MGFLMQKYLFIPARNFSIILCKIPAFYLFCRKSSNIFQKNLRTRGFIRKSLYKYSNKYVNEKFRAGINGYFCIKKILHFNGNADLFPPGFSISMMFIFNECLMDLLKITGGKPLISNGNGISTSLSAEK